MECVVAVGGRRNRRFICLGKLGFPKLPTYTPPRVHPQTYDHSHESSSIGRDNEQRDGDE